MSKFYIHKCLVIEYVSKDNKLCKIITNFIRKRVYTEDIDCMISDKYSGYTRKQNKYTKSIYDNNLWENHFYKKKYEKKIKRCFSDVNILKKIYKTVEGIENENEICVL